MVGLPAGQVGLGLSLAGLAALLGAIPLGSRAIRRAGLALFAAVDVPIIYSSVFFWRTQHPKATVVNTLDPGMRPAFWLSMVTFTVLWAVLMAMRTRVEATRARLDEAQLAADDAGLLDEANA